MSKPVEFEEAMFAAAQNEASKAAFIAGAEWAYDFLITQFKAEKSEWVELKARLEHELGPAKIKGDVE